MGYKSNIENLTIDATGKLSSPTGVIAGAGVSTLDASAILEADSTTKGFLPPRMTTAQRNAISSPSEGLVVYNTDTDNLNFYSGIAWKEATIDPTSNGLVVRTASGASSSRTITAGSGISISNGNGVSGNPTISIEGTEAFRATNLTTTSFAGNNSYMIFSNLNYGSNYSTVTGRYTAPVSGYYQFNTSVVFLFPSLGGTYLCLKFFVNDSMVSSTNNIKNDLNNDGINGAVLSDILFLNAGQYVNVVVLAGSNAGGGNPAFNNVDIVNFFSGFKLK